MRNLPNDIMQYLKNGEQFVYCFKFSNADRAFYLTSNDTPVTIRSYAGLYSHPELDSGSHEIPARGRNDYGAWDGRKLTYLPNSGLEMKSAIFNDSAHDIVLVDGIFEEGGITNENVLNGYSAEVMIYFPEQKVPYILLHYFVDRIMHHDLKFTISLVSESVKLNQSLLSYFSARCRAKFGDEKCGIDKRLHYESINCDKTLRTCCNKFNNGKEKCIG